MNIKLPHHEFWPGRLYESPGYLYLLFHCAVRGVGLKTLFKANAGLLHGGASFASKHDIQKHLGQEYFPTTEALKAEHKTQNLSTAKVFALKYNYPVILKPDYGFTGRGVFKVKNELQLKVILPYLQIDYLIQAFVPSTVEYGVFYIRHQGQAYVSGINKKHFPTVIGDGISNLKQLVQAHERYNHFWRSYLAQHDLNQILPAGQSKRLSDIGSHTLGCKFTNDTYLLTPQLKKSVLEMFKNTSGFNYGRIDLLAKDLAAFQAGNFVMVEANGIESLPTNIFDPSLSLWGSYHILFAHLKALVQVAAENRKAPSSKITIRQFVIQSLKAKKEVEDQQTHLESLPDLSKL